MKPIYSI